MKSKSLYKNVMMPVSVPNSDFCWDGKVRCPYLSASMIDFDNPDSKFAWCGMDLGHPKQLKNKKVKKTPDCLDLKDYIECGL